MGKEIGHFIIRCIHFDNHCLTLLCSKISQMPVSFTFKGTSLQQFPTLLRSLFSLDAGSLHRKTPATSFRVCFSCRKLPYPTKHMPLPVRMHPMTDCTRLLISRYLSPMKTPLTLQLCSQHSIELPNPFRICLNMQMHHGSSSSSTPFAFLFSLHRGGSLMYTQDAEVHISVCPCRMPCWEVLVKSQNMAIILLSLMTTLQFLSARLVTGFCPLLMPKFLSLFTYFQPGNPL